LPGPPICPACGRRFGRGEIVRGKIQCPGCQARLGPDDKHDGPVWLASLVLSGAVCYACGVQGLSWVLLTFALSVPVTVGVGVVVSLFLGVRLVVQREVTDRIITLSEPPPQAGADPEGQPKQDE
jgi:uncharacterized protein (DUF983 family)